MRLTRFAAAIAAALLCACTISGVAAAQTWPGTGPGVFPTIGSVVGSERIPAEDTNNNTVDITPLQIEQYLAANGAILSFLPSPLINGACLSTNGTALLWQNCGFGTVTSVGITLPSWLTATGSPVTSSGTIAISATPGLTQGQVLATPALSSGGVGLRALAATDIPPINLAGTGNGGVFGVTPIANGGTGTQTPGLVAGANITITGSWPNQTISASGGGGGGTGTVTTVSIASANGLSGTVANPTTTPVITLAPTFTGLAMSSGTGFAPATSANIIGLWTGTCNSTTFLRADGTCQTAGGSGSGTVSSVGLSAPTWLTVTGSPVTTTGTLALTGTSEAANEVLASPNGVAGALAPRALVSGDIPTSLPALASASSLATVGTITTGTWDSTPVGAAYGGTGEAGTISGLVRGNGSSPFTAATYPDITALWSGTCSSTTYLRGDGSCQTPAGTGTVTSVALTTPSWLTVGGSPITGAGTLAVTGTSEAANEVIASPNGTAGAVAPRALVGADIPAINLAGTGNGGVTGSLPAASVSGLGTFATQNYATPPAIGGTTPAAGAFTTLTSTGATVLDGSTVPASAGTLFGSTGSFTLNDCLAVGSVSPLQAKDVACGSGGSSAFSSLTGGTNTSAAMLVGAGASLGYTSTGTVNANELFGATVPASAPCLASNSLSQLIACTTLAIEVNGTALASASSLNFENGTGIAITNPSGGNVQIGLPTSGATAGSYTNANITVNAEGIVTAASSGSGGSTAFSAITGGTNTTAAMLVGTGGSLGPTGSGTVNSNEVDGATVPISASVLSSNSAAQLTAATTTGSGSVVLATSPALTTPNIGAATGTSLSVSGQLSSTVATGTAPFVVSSTTQVANLQAATAGNLSGTPALPNGTTATTQTTGDNTTKLATDAFVIANAASAGVASAAAGTGIAITGTGSGPYTGAITISTTAPSRTVTTSTTVASTDMGGQIVMNVSGGGTLTIPAISSTVFPAGTTLSVVNYSASTAAVSTTPTVNSGGGCVTGTGIPSGDSWQLLSNGTTLDCAQTISAASGSGISGLTAGQVAIAGSATTITSSKALAGSGTGITTGPTSSTSGDVVTYTGTAGQTADSGTALTSLVTVLANGSQALGTTAIASGTCATTIQVAVSGGTTSDSAKITPTTDPNTVTGYKASASGSLYVNAFMTSGELNIEVCNNTASSITPSAISVHYLVTSP